MGTSRCMRAALFTLLLAVPCHVFGQALYIPGGGAAHLSMGGASTATPVDAIGALYWNPAAIGRLGHSEVAIGGNVLIPRIDLTSTAPSPLGPITGTTRSDSGVGLASNVGIVYQPEERSLIYGLGMATIAGACVNYPGDVNNPVLSGIGLLGNVQGPIYSSLTFVQLTPSVAAKLGDNLVVGVGPMIDAALTSFDPAYFGSPDDANGDGIGTFPTATHARPFWGLGFRVGAVYSVSEKLDVGVAYTSQQWFETWVDHARDELGQPRTLTLKASLPAIYSAGIGYHASEKLLVNVDLRWFDYKNTDLFGTSLRDGGLGWKNVFAVATGGRYQMSDRLAVSAGYVYNDNPIESVGTLFNVQAPAIVQHTVAFGATMALTDSISASLGYAYSFRNSISGPVREATGFGVSYAADAQQVTFTTQFRFGGCGCRRPCSSCTSCASCVGDLSNSASASASAPAASEAVAELGRVESPTPQAARFR